LEKDLEKEDPINEWDESPANGVLNGNQIFSA
jgi:hypothetical protein